MTGILRYAVRLVHHRAERLQLLRRSHLLGSLTRRRLNLTHGDGARLTGRIAAHTFLESLRDASVHCQIFLGQAIARYIELLDRVPADLPIERYRIILNLLDGGSTLTHQVVVQGLQLSLIVRIVADLVQLGYATRSLLYLNVGLLTLSILQTVLVRDTAHFLHAGSSISLRFRLEWLHVAHLTGLFASRFLRNV